jgi:hypothetical protein
MEPWLWDLEGRLKANEGAALRLLRSHPSPESSGGGGGRRGLRGAHPPAAAFSGVGGARLNRGNAECPLTGLVPIATPRPLRADSS